MPKPQYTVDQNTNRLGVPGGQTGAMSYDAAGNLTFDSYKGEGARVYDAENRMTKAWANDQWQIYCYDGDGRRIKRIVNGNQTWQVYGVDGALVAEYSAGADSSSPQKEYAYRNGQLLVTAEGNSNLHWLATDQLGTPRMIFDNSGSLSGTSRHDYLPFGEELFAGTNWRTTDLGYNGDSVRQQFTQKERDNETGLDYFGARYYGNPSGRFVSVDAYLPMVDADKREVFRRYLEQPQNWNRYSYCVNNPLVFVDPNGLGWYVLKGELTGHPEWFDDDKVDKDKYEGVLFYVYRSVESNKYYALNPFKNEMVETNTAEEAMGAYQGYIINEALADTPRLPDAVDGNVGFMTEGANLTYESHGNLYGGFDVYPRIPINDNATKLTKFFKLGGCINMTWLNQFEKPTEEQANKFFTGPTTTATIGSHGLGAGETWSPGNGTATNFGVCTPGFSFSGGTANQLGKFRFRWNN